MSFILSHNIERARRFDQLVVKTDELLGNSALITELGSLAVPIQTMHADIFLPNVRCGRASVPLSLRDTEATALLPVLPGENGVKLAMPILTDLRQLQALPEMMYSEAYGDFVEVAKETQRPCIKRHDAKLAKTEADHHAASTVNATHMQLSPLAYRRSRTVEVVHDYVADWHAAHAASVIIHEHVHAWDQRMAGPLAGTAVQKTYSEFRANYAEAKVSLYIGDVRVHLEPIEAIRLATTDPRYPFRPTTESVRRLSEITSI